MLLNPVLFQCSFPCHQPQSILKINLPFHVHTCNCRACGEAEAHKQAELTVDGIWRGEQCKVVGNASGLNAWLALVKNLYEVVCKRWGKGGYRYE